MIWIINLKVRFLKDRVLSTFSIEMQGMAWVYASLMRGSIITLRGMLGTEMNRFSKLYSTKDLRSLLL
jgi:hypothetical protein